MKKVTLPAPPQSALTTASSFRDAAPQLSRATSPQGASTREAAARQGEDFLVRTYAGTACLGALLSMATAQLFHSGAGLSVGIGVALSLALLKSQQIVVNRVTRHFADGKSPREYSPVSLWQKMSAIAPLLLVGIVKYVFAGMLLTWAWRQNWFSLAGFFTGFALLHLVLLARVAGSLIAARVRPVREIYSTHA